MLKVAQAVNVEYATRNLDVLRDEVAHVCRRIPPLWDLPNYVAVNPFLGFASQSLADAAREINDGLGGHLLPALEFYRARWKEGAFGQAELEQAARRAGQEPGVLKAILQGEVPVPLRPASEEITFAERHDRRYDTNWNDKIIQHVTLWCAVYAAEGGNPWVQREVSQGLYASWRASAQVDRSLEIAGLKGWRAWVKALPEDPMVAIATMLAQLQVPDAERPAYLYRLLGGVFGWASYFRRAVWEAGSEEPGAVGDLLAIRICTDAAVAQLAPHPDNETPRPFIPTAVEDESVRFLLQDALEDGYARKMLRALVPPPAQPPMNRPSVQAVFCIDVRSEIMRRQLESLDPGIETLGFAGFFGVSLDWYVDGKSSARCPVLLKPAVRVSPAKPNTNGIGKSALKQVQTAPTAAYTFVETLGLAYGVSLAADALNSLRIYRNDEGTTPFTLEPDGHGSGIAPADRVASAAAILKNMGLRDRFARIVLLCGHESQTENNPHAAGLDCGACCGHSGAINARVAAALLNDPAVREHLPAQGYAVPEDTWFVPGVHNTMTDAITLFDTGRIPASHRNDVAQLRRWLEQAGKLVRAERAATLGLSDKPGSLLDQVLRRRARDWSEVRPEWALARNAAFIAARRARTRGVNLEGRSFLHEYDWTTDPDNSILTLILSAPVVVATWINLQYFASTVDNRVFGCGTKALHNRVGSLGVVLGNGGDLRTGLALQSVQTSDGRWFHEPLRLQVVVEAPRERIEAVFAAVADVRDLVENGWIRIFALDPDSTTVARRVPGHGWEEEIL